jgi:hypothetical protein
VKKLAIAFVLFLGLAVASLAQTVAPAPAPEPVVQHFVISVSASGYGGQKGTQAESIAGTALQLTPHVSVGYNQIFNPSDSTQPKYRLGVVNYTRELHDLLGAKLSSKFVFDTTRLIVTFQGGAGKVSYEGVNRIAETGGAFLSFPLADHVSFQLVGYQVLHGQGTSTLTRSTTGQMSSGLYFTF